MITALPLSLISWQIVDSTLSSPPGFNPKLMSSRTLQAIQRSSVTRATAAKRIPVVRHTMSRMVGIALMPPTAAISCANVLLIGESRRPPPDLLEDDYLLFMSGRARENQERARLTRSG